jgi:hypothetical protein
LKNLPSVQPTPHTQQKFFGKVNELCPVVTSFTLVYDDTKKATLKNETIFCGHFREIPQQQQQQLFISFSTFESQWT